MHAAISALYGQHAAQQKEANDFLVTFAATQDAWEVSLSLVSAPEPSVQYFGANMLYGKVKSDWGRHSWILLATSSSAFRTLVC